jgi:signal transduction histidine kinase
MTENRTIEGENLMDAPKTDVVRDLDELRLEVAQLQASRRRLVLAADAERRMIERALHDSLQQQLIGLAADLELAVLSIEADPEAAMRHLIQMRRDLREALEESRTLASRIHPALDAGGLGPALRFAADGAGSPTQVDVVVGASIPSEVAGAVYFCCVDVLERTTDATTITVRERSRALTFEIVMVGDVDAERSPLRDRVEALGGSLTIRSAPGPRTVWTGAIPLP